VVVRDHDLDAGGLGGGDFLDRADPAVHRDHQLGAAALQLLDARHRQAVAASQPVRDEPVALGAERAKGRDEDRRRGHPVDVVVAMDGDPSRAARDREDLVADLLHAAELGWLVRLARLEEAPRRIDRAIPATDERHRDRLGELQLRGQPPDLPVVIRIGLKRTG
jgi:hypothetical protein